MCYAKPGPRCSQYAQNQLQKAKDSKELERILHAQDEYDETPAGQAEIKKVLEELPLGRKKLEYETRLKSGIFRRKNKIAMHEMHKKEIKNTENHFDKLNVQHIVDQVRTSGGATVSSDGTEPQSGFVINRVGKCIKITEEDFFHSHDSERVLGNFLTKSIQSSHPTKDSIGIWHDKENSVVILDKVDIVAKLSDAEDIAKRRNQRFIYDLSGRTQIKIL